MAAVVHFSGTAWSSTGKMRGPSLNWMLMATGTWPGLASDQVFTSVRQATSVGQTEW